MLVISALLLLGLVAGYAAVSSPELRGPYATPRPSVVNAPRFTLPPRASFEPPVIFQPIVPPCVLPAAVHVPAVFVGATTYVYDEHGQSVIEIIRSDVNAACSPVIWGQSPSPIPYERVAR
jgi:hypothetical protein